MDLNRAQRFGRAGYRGNYMPPNPRQSTQAHPKALDSRLHPPGLSTSSNSSWTFSNSHDVPKPRKGRLCGIFLIGAVLIVALSVIAIGGLAFYIGGYSMEKHHISEYQAKASIGAKRQYSTNDYAKKSSKHSEKLSSSSTTTETFVEASQVENKRIPPGAILGISKTMQQLNKGLLSRKAENEEEEVEIEVEELREPTEFMTEIYESPTESVSATEEPIRSVVITKNVEILPKNSRLSEGNGEVVAVEMDGDESPNNENIFRDRKDDENVELMQNGHARPSFSAPQITSSSTTEITSTGGYTPLMNIFPPRRDYSDEPWRPIIPTYRDNVRIRNSYHEKYPEKVFEHRYGPPIEPVIPMVNDENGDEVDDMGPITFSQDSFNKNLRITPEYAGGTDEDFIKPINASSISGEIAAKFKDLLRPKIHEMGTVEMVSDDIITAPPAQSADVILVSNDRVVTASASFPQPVEVFEVHKAPNPDGVEELLSSVSVLETDTTTVKSSTDLSPLPATTSSPTVTGSSTLLTSTSKLEVKTTPKAATIKAILKIAGMGNPEQPAQLQVKDRNESAPKTTTAKAELTTERPLSTTAQHTTTKQSMLPSSSLHDTVEIKPTQTILNPFLDDSRSSSSNFNFGLPDLPIIKQFHHLDGIFKSFSKPTPSEPEKSNSFPKYFPRGEFGNETSVTRFPARTKQTTVKSFRNEEDNIYVEVSTITPDRATRPITTRKSVLSKGDVHVVSGPVGQDTTPTTEIPKLITLLPVRSNVNMMRPLRPRPKSSIDSITTARNPKMSVDFKTSTPEPKTPTSVRHHIVQNENGKVWVYYPSYKPTMASARDDPKKVHIVTPEPKNSTDPNAISNEDKFFNFTGNLTSVPVYNAIENLLNYDHRNRNKGNSSVRKPEVNSGKAKKNTSEIVDRIVKIMENIAIATDDSPEAIVKVNQTVMNKTTTPSVGGSSTNSSETGGPAKFSSHYKLNQAGVPVLTKVLNKAPATKIPDNTPATTTAAVTEKNVSDVPTTPIVTRIPQCNSSDCDPKASCLAPEKKCNQIVDCPDAVDEKNCTCADHLRVQQLHRKLCDGIIDCWDFTDEYNCEWCKDEFLCSNSKMCIKKSQICDGSNDCPFGDDERNCVTISPSRSDAENINYHSNGFLMVRKNGRWGKLCIDNFDSVSLKSKTGWKISDLGRSVCKALTFRDFDKVERMISVPNEGRSLDNTEQYYELAYNNSENGSQLARDSILTFHETNCVKKEVVKVTCTDLECGLRPQATSQWPRIVGGGNAAPGSWPWQAALYREGKFQCGGTLISENWLISAGHCFYHHQESYWVARLGTLRTTLSLPSPYEQLGHITKILIHPQYKDHGFINDISLLQMRHPVKLTDYVRPICLPKPQTTIIDGAVCTIVGWGQLSEVGWVFPDTLQEVQLPILSTSECRKRTLFLSLYKITDDMFCAGYDRGGRDACLGDSGGPLMCTEPDGRWTLYGITSNGFGCARSNRPGVYTKVSKYLTWIHSEMKAGTEEPNRSEKIDSAKSLSRRVESTTIISESSSVSYSASSSSLFSMAKKLSETVGNLKNDSPKITFDSCPGLRCPLGECLPKSKICNGRLDCSDGSDEKDCW